jgi:hypothetical protein
MKIRLLLILFAILVSCKQKERENILNDDSSKINEDNLFINSFSDELINIELDITEIKLAHINDNDMKQSEIENNLIDSLNEAEQNQKIIEILDRPFENLGLTLFSEYSKKRLFNGIEELLNIFNIYPSQNINEKFKSFDPYEIIKITIYNMTLYIYKEDDKSYKLFFVEYNKDILYEPKLKIGYTKDEITLILGNPSAYSNERDIFIYNSNNTLRQINIFFENDKVEYVQLISWGGI